MNQPQHDRRIQTVCLIVLTAVVIAFALYWLKSVLVPFILSYFFVTALEPLVGFQVERFKAPRAVAIGLTMIVGVLIFAALTGGIAASVAQFPDTESQGDSEIGFRQWLTGKLENLEALGVPNERIADISSGVMTGLKAILAAIADSVVSLLSQGAMVLLFILFMLTGSSSPHVSRGVFPEIQGLVRKYIISKTILSAVTGLVVGIIFALLGVKLAFLFALFAFLLNFIPTIGSAIATFLPLPFVLSQDPELSTTVVVLALVLPGISQFVIGTIVEPRLLGKSLDLHPVAVLLALAFWGSLWGGIGTLLAVPITSVVRILLQQLELTAPLAEVIAGRSGAPPE